MQSSVWCVENLRIQNAKKEILIPNCPQPNFIWMGETDFCFWGGGQNARWRKDQSDSDCFSISIPSKYFAVWFHSTPSWRMCFLSLVLFNGISWNVKMSKQISYCPKQFTHKYLPFRTGMQPFHLLASACREERLLLSANRQLHCVTAKITFWSNLWNLRGKDIDDWLWVKVFCLSWFENDLNWSFYRVEEEKFVSILGEFDNPTKRYFCPGLICVR